jgi:hypothetical protein
VLGISEQRQHCRPRESRADHRRYPAERR